MSPRGLVYLIGSLRNPEVPHVADFVRSLGWDVFDDWYAAGPRADDHWREYEEERGRTYLEALRGRHATNVFDFDRKHLDMANLAVLVLPAGKSGFLELGYAIGKGKDTYVLLDRPDRWDVMLRFATGVYEDLDSLLTAIK